MINGLSSFHVVLSPSNPISDFFSPDSMFFSMVSSARVPVSVSIAFWVEVSSFCCFEFPLNLPL
jgi:hypothetical protein